MTDSTPTPATVPHGKRPAPTPTQKRRTPRSGSPKSILRNSRTRLTHKVVSSCDAETLFQLSKLVHPANGN